MRSCSMSGNAPKMRKQSSGRNADQIGEPGFAAPQRVWTAWNGLPLPYAISSGTGPNLKNRLAEVFDHLLAT